MIPKIKTRHWPPLLQHSTFRHLRIFELLPILICSSSHISMILSILRYSFSFFCSSSSELAFTHLLALLMSSIVTGLDMRLSLGRSFSAKEFSKQVLSLQLQGLNLSPSSVSNLLKWDVSKSRWSGPSSTAIFAKAFNSRNENKWVNFVNSAVE